MADPERAACLHVVEGNGRLLLGEAGELRRVSPPAIEMTAGDVFFVSPGAHYGLVNEGDTPLRVSEQRIPWSTAFV
jgi:mannose-6-phosphate isomerase-like protein (cupin superfamily)